MEIIEYISLYTFPCDCNVDIKLERYELSACYDLELDLYLITCPRCGRTIVVGVDEIEKHHTTNTIIVKDLKNVSIVYDDDNNFKEIIIKLKID